MKPGSWPCLAGTEHRGGFGPLALSQFTWSSSEEAHGPVQGPRLSPVDPEKGDVNDFSLDLSIGWTEGLPTLPPGPPSGQSCTGWT